MKTTSSIAATVLAAGRGRRFGGDKRRYPLAGIPLLQRALALPLGRGMKTLLVLRPEDAMDIKALTGPWYDNQNLVVVYAAQAAQGMGHSLSAAAIEASAFHGLLVLLGDMPYLNSRTLMRLCDAHQSGRICVPRYDGLSGHPVLFDRAWYKDLQNLKGDRGAKSIIRANPNRVHFVDVDDPGILADIDHAPAGEPPAALKNRL